jgi:hypothetical protein
MTICKRGASQLTLKLFGSSLTIAWTESGTHSILSMLSTGTSWLSTSWLSMLQQEFPFPSGRASIHTEISGKIQVTIPGK